MWSPRKFLALAFCGTLLLSGCGFEPMYGEQQETSGKPSALQGNLDVQVDGNDRFSQILRNALEDKFNPESIKNEHPEYKLKLTMTRQVVPSVIRSDGTILRYNVTFNTYYTFTNLLHKEQAFTGTIKRINSYNVVPNGNFSTYVAEEDLNQRMLKEIAEDYVLRITGHLAGKS